MASRFFSPPPFFLLFSTLIIFSLLAAAATTTSSTTPGNHIVGVRTEIKDVTSNKKVQALGSFSVAEYNRQVSRHVDPRQPSRATLLAFARVVQAESQVVSGVRYYLKVVVRDHAGAEKVFDAVVVVKSWLKSKELVSFVPSLHV